MKLHPSITPDRVMDAVERRMFSLDNPGFCVSCGNEQDGCEPDMRRGSSAPSRFWAKSEVPMPRG